MGARRRPTNTVLSVGIEHEFVVTRAGEQIDFRNLVAEGKVPGIRIDPGDRNAFRTPTGLAITADGAEAEYASPPVEVAAGFVAEVLAWAATGGSLVGNVVGTDAQLEGVSSHISVTVPFGKESDVARRFARTFAPALMLLTDSNESPGLLVRPRYGRVELGTDYAIGDSLAAALVVAVGGVVACTSDSFDLPTLQVDLEPAVDRFGWYVDRTAFGGDLYDLGRDCSLRSTNSEQVSAQDHLERCWKLAQDSLLGLVGPDDLVAAFDLVSGMASLPCETAHNRLPASGALAPFAPESLTTSAIKRPNFVLNAVVGTWAYTVFEIAGPRQMYVSVPRPCLADFCQQAVDGELDAIVGARMAKRSSGQLLERFEHGSKKVAYFDGIGGWESLAPPEPRRDGIMRVAATTSSGSPTSGLGAAATEGTAPGSGSVIAIVGGGDEPPARPSKFLPPIEEEVIIGGFPWRWIIGSLIGIGVIIALISLIGGGGEQEIEIVTPPVPTAEQEATAVPEPTEVPTVEPTSVPSPTATAVPWVPPEQYAPAVSVLRGAFVDDSLSRSLVGGSFEDGMFDWVYSSSDYIAGNPGGDVDLWDVGAGQFPVTRGWADTVFNQSVFECGETTSLGTTVCGSGDDVGEGEMIVTLQVLSGPVAGEDWTYQYAAVFDADNSPANNWQPQGMFDWDYFQGTDTWFVIDYAQGQWSGGVYGGSFSNPVASAFRAVILDNVIVWFVPKSEVPQAQGVQVTSFRHDGSFAPEFSGGDVAGANPTGPLIAFIELDTPGPVDVPTPTDESPVDDGATAVEPGEPMVEVQTTDSTE